MHYAQRLLAARPTTGAGARTILAVLTAFGIVTTTAGVAAMPLLTGNEVVNDTGARTDCRPAARMVYPEGQSAPEYVVPVYETGSMGGVDAVLSDWCSTAGNVLEDPSITLNVVEGQTVTPHLLPGIKAELERPAPANGEQDVFIPTDYLVRGMRQATGDSGWEVGKRVFSLTFSSGTVSATTGLFSFVKQDPDIIKPPTPEPTSEPSAQPSAEPTHTSEPDPEPDPTGAPSTEPTEEPTAVPTPSSEATATSTPSPDATATSSPATEPTATPDATATPDPEPIPSASPTPSQNPTVATCQAEPAVKVVNPDGSDPQGSQPAYTSERSIRISGSGWCENGTMLNGEKPIELKLVAYGGYRNSSTASLPVTFSNGSFNAQINLSSLATGADLKTGRYYLQVSPRGSGLTKSTNVFGYEAPVVPEPTPVPTPTTTPTQGPTAEPSVSASPSPSAEPTTEPTTEPTSEPSSGPSGSPSAEPSVQPSASAAPEPGPGGPASTTPDQGVLNQDNTDNTTDRGAGNASNGEFQASEGLPAGTSVLGGPGTDRGQDQQSGQRGGEAGSASNPQSSEGAEEPAQAPANATAEDRTARPDRNPVPPVTSAAQLSADNAGSLSGSRQGNIVNLVLPRAKASSGDWVSVFVFPGATTKGWVQVDSANSISIDISTFESGSYELAVADRDNSLLGWAKLEIASASFDPRSPGQAQLLTFPDRPSTSSTGLSANDMLLGGAGGLLVIGAGSLLVAARSGLPLRAPRILQRLRVPRR